MRRWFKIASLILAILLVIALIPFFFEEVGVLDGMPLIEREPGMLIIGLISDTHIPSRSRKLPDKVFEAFKEVDMIIHAGDLVQMEVIRVLEEIAPTVMVHGNMDSPEVKAELPGMNSVEISGWRIGVIHDPGALWDMGKMKRIAEENGFDVLVFGHTHKQCVKWENDILFINPGSPTNPLPPLIVKPSVGLLLIKEEEVKPLIIGV